MIAVAMAAAATWIGLLGWKSRRSISLFRQFHEEAIRYSEIEKLIVERIGVVQAQVERYEAEATESERNYSESKGPSREELRLLSSVIRNVLTEREKELDFQREEASRFSAFRRHYELLEAKYRRLALQPWLSVEADPELPE
jgi:hypothetical protein